jgi:type II secretory pathway pseudopilin PulG
MCTRLLPARRLHWRRPVSTPRGNRSERGFALIDVLFVCGILGILSALVMPRLLMARQSAGAASAIGSMRSISSAQLTYALTCGGGFYAPKLTTLGMPPPGSDTPYISPNLSTADTIDHSGYLVQMTGTPFAGAPPTCNGLGGGEASQGFKAGADALEPTNFRFFAVNANGQIFEDTSSMFAAMPEVGQPAVGRVLK